ncbi:MAG: hypothetical protein H6Q79_2860, partial [Deltaproteobacteria bacterium]|nr:hypothetical protein [Deltaproteobacteria bacterium]
DISAHGSPAKWEVSGIESFDIIGDHILPGDIIRNTAISLLLNSGADPFTALKPAGHSDVRLTMQVYSHVFVGALRKAAGVLDRIGLDGEGGTGTAYRQAMASGGGGGETAGVRVPS